MILAWLLACGASEAPVEPTPPPDPVSAAAPRPAPRTPVVVKPGERHAAWSDARCNDGSPFAYTHRPGTTDTWIVHLSGGAFCDDLRNPCAERKPRLVTTLPAGDGAPTRARRQGIFSPDPRINPTFADAHHVDAHYCSSDLWLGTSLERQPNSADPEGWYFSGRRNVEVLLASLQEDLALADRDTVRILLLGTSAGGAGAVGNVDQFVAAFPRAVADGRLKMVLDASWVADLPADSITPDADRWGPVQAECAARLEAAGVDPVRCVIGTEWWPHVKALGVPVLVQISGVDLPQADLFGIDTPAERAAWRATVLASLAELPWVFSGGHPYHVVASEGLFRKGREGQRFVDVLDEFWSGEPPRRVFVRYDQETSP